MYLQPGEPTHAQPALEGEKGTGMPRSSFWRHGREWVCTLQGTSIGKSQLFLLVCLQHWLLQAAVSGQTEICCMLEGTLSAPPGAPMGSNHLCQEAKQPHQHVLPVPTATGLSSAGLMIGRNELPTKRSAGTKW